MNRMRIYPLLAAFLLLFFISPKVEGKGIDPFAVWNIPDGGFIYITPNDETKLRTVDVQGVWGRSFITEFGKDSLLMPWDIVGTPDGWIFVLDRMKATVKVYDEKYKYQYSIGEKGTGYGQLKSPRALAIDARGFLYIANNGKNQIEKFTLEGNHVGYLEPDSGEGVGTEFKYITAMVVAPDGELFICVDSDDPQVLRNIYRYNTEGELTGNVKVLKWGGAGTFTDLFLNEDGTLLVVDTPASSGGFAGAIWQVDQNGQMLNKYEAYDTDFDRYYSPVEVIVRDGQMYIFCAEKKCLVFSTSGGYLYSFGL